MHLSDVLSSKTMDLSERCFKNKIELFNFMAGMLKDAGSIDSKEDFLVALERREDTGSTYMGNFLAIPHGKSKCVIRTSAAFCRCTPLEYESGGEKGVVNLVMMLAVAEHTNDEQYLEMLSNVAKLLLNKRFLRALSLSYDCQKILDIGERELEVMD